MSRNTFLVAVLAVALAALTVVAACSLPFGSVDHAAEHKPKAGTTTAQATGRPQLGLRSKVAGTQIADVASSVLSVAAMPLQLVSAMSPDDEHSAVEGTETSEPASEQSGDAADPDSRSSLPAEHQLLRETLDDLEDLMVARDKRGGEGN